ncbi:MAG TPA: PKD domain-containing protein, partial [Tepidisphaeraceae bacterium]
FSPQNATKHSVTDTRNQSAFELLNDAFPVGAADTTPPAGYTPATWAKHVRQTRPSAPIAPPLPVSLGGPVTPLIEKIEGSGLAGETVFVNALESGLGGDNPLTARFHWNFGDPAGEFNELDAYNAAHAYDQPGTYTITLTINSSDGTVSSVSTQVAVAPDARRTIYVAAGGDDGNSGLAPDQPVQSLSRAQALLADNTRVLFNRGDTFTFTTGLTVANQNVEVGAYGEGGAPILMSKAFGSQGMIIPTITARNLLVDNLTFDTIWTSNTDEGPPYAVWNSSSEITVRNNTFLNVGYAYNGSGQPQGVFLVDNQAPLVTGIRGYFAWMQGTDYVVLNNTVANSTREHDIRMTGVQRVAVLNNNFANLDLRPGDPNDFSKGTIVVHNADYVYVARNTVQDGPIGLGPLGGTDGLKGDYLTQRTRWCVVEYNTAKNTQLVINHGTENCTVRYNTVYSNNIVQIPVQGYDKTYKRGVANTSIIGNIGVNNSVNGNFLHLYGLAFHLTMNTNIYMSPYLTPPGNGNAVVYVDQSDLSAFDQISGNIWPLLSSTVPMYVGFGSAGRLTAAQWLALPQVSGDMFIPANF